MEAFEGRVAISTCARHGFGREHAVFAVEIYVPLPTLST
jgi:hypothetical protein